MQELEKIWYYISDMLRYNKVVPIEISLVKDLLDYQNDLVWDGLDNFPRLCASPRWFARPPDAFR
jgi:hypothetical protein